MCMLGNLAHRLIGSAGFFGRLRGARGANVAIVTALSFPLMLGFVGLTAEVGTWLVTKRAMQGAADAAAFSAAATLQANSTSSSANTMACTVGEATAAQNGFANGVSGFSCGSSGYTCAANTSTTCVTVNIPPLAGNCTSGCNYAAEVIIQAPQGPLIAGFFGAVGPMINARAVAGVPAAATGPACVLALGDATAGSQSLGSTSYTANSSNNLSDAFEDTAGGNITLTNCTVCVNSTNSTAAANDTAGGTLTATAIDIAGKWTGNGTTSPAPTQNMSPPSGQSTLCTDPYATKYNESNYTQTCSFALPVNGSTASGSANLSFASTSLGSSGTASVMQGMFAVDVTNTSAIPSNTYVSSVSATGVTLSANVASTRGVQGITATGSVTNNSTTLTLTASNSNIVANMAVSGTGIPTGTTVTSVSGTSVTMSSKATSTAAGETVSFGDLIDFNWYLDGGSSYHAGVSGQTNFVYCANGFNLNTSTGTTSTISGTSYNTFPSGTYWVLGGEFEWTSGNVTNASGGITFILGGPTYQWQTNAPTVAGGNTLTFPYLPVMESGSVTSPGSISLDTNGQMTLYDLTNTSAIASGTTIHQVSASSPTSTTITMSANAAAAINPGDVILIGSLCHMGAPPGNPNQPHANGYAWLDWTGGGDLNFTAPTSGTYSGMLVMVDPCSPFETSTSQQAWVDITAGSSTIMTGAVYAPSALIKTTEGATASNACMQIVGNMIETTAGGALSGTGCTAAGVTTISSQIPGSSGVGISISE